MLQLSDVEFHSEVHEVLDVVAEEMTHVVCDYNALWRRRHLECQQNRTRVVSSSDRPAYCLSSAYTLHHRSSCTRIVLLLRFVLFIVHISTKTLFLFKNQ